MSSFRHVNRNVVFAACMMLAIPASSLAQQVYGSIFGTVTDASGSGVPNATITITEPSKNVRTEATTNETGNFTKGQLIPGTYSVEVAGTGFSRSVINNIVVQVDQAARIDVALQIGATSETVEVTAAVPTLQADRADVQTTFTAKQLIDLPSLGRNVQAYELLAPGVSRIGFAHASSENPQGSVQAEVNGQHFSGTGFQLDGTENQDPILGIIVINPNIDSLSEIKIAAQDYDAEFGYAGAGIQNHSTKSGTNQLHGSAFDYFRNNSNGFQDFARDPFSEPNGAPILRFNQFGGSIGGKVIKDKLFFFGDTELVRQRFGGSVLTTVPTADARNGDFSAYLAANPQNAIYDPATGDPVTGVGRTQFPGNRIPANRISSQARALLAYFPQPNTGGGNPFNNYAAGGGGSFDANKFDTRADYFKSQSTSIFGRYSYQQFARGAVGAFGSLAGGPAFNTVNFAGNSFVRNQSIAIGLTHTFTPTLISDFRFGYVKYKVNTTPNGYGTQPATAAGIPGANLDTTFTSGLPYFNFRDTNDNQVTSLGYGLGANQCNCPLNEDEGQYQFTGNVTKIQGNHTLKFGADIRYAKNLRVPSDSHRSGEFTFNTQNTGLINSVGGSAVNGLAFATFLLGDVTGFQRYVSTSTDAAERQRRWFFYGQDSWRVTPKLTVNFGLRWELVFPETVNGKGNGAQLDLATGLINVFGVGNVSDHGVQQMNYANFAPRLGIAYQLNPKTVIRSGYGWSYELGTFGATFGHNVTQNPPVLFNQSPSSPNGKAFQSVFNLASGPPSPNGLFVVPASGQFILPDNVGAKARSSDVRLPRVEAYNLTVERQIAAHTSLSIGYVGNVGRHVGAGSGDGFNYNVNQAAFVPGTVDSNTLKPFYNKIGANGLPLHWTQGIDLYCQCLTNKYNSLQVQLKRSYANGYTTQVSYTLQDAVGDNSDSYTILYNRPLGRGRENAIPDHELTVAQSYDIPFGKGKRFGANLNPVVDKALGGWTLSGTTFFYSGLPFTPNISSYPAGVSRPDQGPGNRPDLGSGSPYASNQNRDHFLNIGTNGALSSAFVVPTNNAYGNYGFNTLRGPIFIDQDLSIAKNIAITERFRAQLRGEAYNVFNHTNLGGVNNNVNGNNAGNITSIAYGSTMRRLQFALRFDF